MGVNRKIDFTLQAVLDPHFIGKRPLSRVVKSLVAGGVSVIQMREKDISTRDFLAKALQLRKITRELGIPLLINDRLDIALAIKADGVHLGQKDMPLSYARKIWGENGIIGVSTHDLREAKKAEAEGATYIAVGSIYPTTTKKDAILVGISTLKKIKKAVNIPIVAIGGIRSENVEEVIRAGADGVASISTLLGTSRLTQTARDFRRRIERARTE